MALIFKQNEKAPIKPEHTHFIIYGHEPDDVYVQEADLAHYWDQYDNLCVGADQECIRGFDAPKAAEACVNLRSISDTYWLIGTPHEQCHL